MNAELFRLNGARSQDPSIDEWFSSRPAELGELARSWFEVMRNCGDEVRELIHDGCPVACLGDFPFAYVNAFREHVNVGFFQGAFLKDPAGLLQGSGRYMRHVKLRPGVRVDADALTDLIVASYADMKHRVENG